MESGRYDKLTKLMTLVAGGDRNAAFMLRLDFDRELKAAVRRAAMLAGSTRDVAALAFAGEQALAAVLPDLRKPFPRIEGMVSTVRVYRWQHAWTVFSPGALRHLGYFRAGKIDQHPRVALAGDYLSAPNVEGAVASGLHAAERVLAAVGGRPA